jgi:putative Holliday junction resolvase
MAIIEITEIPNTLSTGQTLIGLYLGTKTIGIAVSDLGLRFANPRPLIKRTKFKFDAEELITIMTAENAGIAIIGLPANMNGTEGPRVQATRAFVSNMAKLTEVPFAFWDERLSTVAAERALIGMDVSRKKRKERIDSAAAAFILQGALDRLSSLRRENTVS